MLMAAVSCKKQTTATSTTSTSILNATEKKMIGKWYLQKVVSAGGGWWGDSTLTGYDSNAYIIFSESRYAYDTAPLFNGNKRKNLSFRCSDFCKASTPAQVASWSEFQSTWFYDEASNCLGLPSSWGAYYTDCYKLVSVNEHELIIKCAYTVDSTMSYFQK